MRQLTMLLTQYDEADDKVKEESALKYFFTNNSIYKNFLLLSVQKDSLKNSSRVIF